MASDLAPVLPFPKRLGFCPQCGWRHPDPNIKLITHCPECDAAPLYPWKCPECGEMQEATAKDLIRWSLTTRRHPSRGIRFGFHNACPSCADDAGNLEIPDEVTPE